MDFAAPFPFNLISLPAWVDTAICNTRQAADYSYQTIKAFSKTLAPVIATTAKDLSHYYWLCFQGAEQWTTDRQPISSGVRAVHAKLTSPASIATYRRISHIVREAAMDALVVGLCGVVAVSVGVDVAQKGYRAAATLYRAVYGRLNPSEPVPTITMLPSVGMAIAADEFAAALSKVADVAEADIKAKAQAFQPDETAELVPDFWSEPLPLIHTPPVVGAMWNPAPGRDMHQEVARLYELQHVPLTLPAPIIELTALEPVVEQKPAPEATNELATAFDVPGAIGGQQRKPKTKASTSKAAAAKPKEARARAGAKAGK
jgi:hypothetical protein